MVVGTTVEISIIVPFTKENVRFYFETNKADLIFDYTYSCSGLLTHFKKYF